MRTNTFIRFLIALILVQPLVAADDAESAKEGRLALEKLAASQAAIASYQVDVTMSGSSMSSNGLSRVDVKKEYRFESSREQNYQLTFIRVDGVLTAMGKSGDCVIYGKKLGAKDGWVVFSDPERAPEIRISERKFWDPFSVGFGSMNDIELGISFEELWDSANTIVYGGETEPDGLIRVTTGDGYLLLDSKKGYWPKESLFYFSVGKPKPLSLIWKSTLTEVKKGIYLPTHATLDIEDLQASLKIDLDWKSINEPIETGLDRAKALAREYHARLEINP